MKYCKLCGETIQDEFYESRNKRCKACCRAKQYEFNRNNPQYLKAKNQRRRARLAALPDTLTKEQTEEIYAFNNGRCWITDSTDVFIGTFLAYQLGHRWNNVRKLLCT